MPSIRELTEADAEAFRAVRLRGLREHPEAFGMSFEEEAAEPVERVAERLRSSSPESFTLGALLDGELAGTIGMNRVARVRTRHKGHIWGMYVVPEASGRGVGRALLSETIARARVLPGLEELVLGVTVGNERARRLYVAAGFVSYCVEPRHFKVGDAYYDLERMRLALTSLMAF